MMDFDTIWFAFFAEEEGKEYNPYITAFQYLRSGLIPDSPVCSPLFWLQFSCKYTLLLAFELWSSKNHKIIEMAPHKSPLTRTVTPRTWHPDVCHLLMANCICSDVCFIINFSQSKTFYREGKMYFVGCLLDDGAPDCPVCLKPLFDLTTLFARLAFQSRQFFEGPFSVQKYHKPGLQWRRNQPLF